MAKLEKTYLSKLVGQTIESVYNKLYENQDGGFQVRVKTKDGEKMLLLNEREADWFGKYFKKGNQLRVYKNDKGYVRVIPADSKSKSETSEEPKEQQEKKTTKNTTQVRNSVSEKYLYVLFKHTAQAMLDELRKELARRKYSYKAIDQAIDYIKSKIDIDLD